MFLRHKQNYQKCRLQNFSTKRELVLPLMQIELGLLQESANFTFNHENAFKQI